MQKNGKKIFEDSLILTILSSTFLTGIEKITVLDKCISFFDDAYIIEEYLITWKLHLNQIFENQNQQNLQGIIFKEKVSRFHSQKRGETAYDNTYKLKAADARLDIQDWNHQYYEDYKVVYKMLSLGTPISIVKLKQILIMVTNNWDLSSITNYYKIPLIWIEKKLAELAKPVETPEAIRVNIVSSQFVYLLTKLHEKEIITLPIHKDGNINMLSTSKVILSVFDMVDLKNQKVNSALLLSANFNVNRCSKDAKKTIDESVQFIEKIITKTRSRNSK